MTGALAAATLLEGSLAFTMLLAQPGMVRHSTFGAALSPSPFPRRKTGARWKMSGAAAVAKATAAAAAPLVAALPTAQILVAACTIPTLLGYWKSEYGVSYA